KAAAPPEGRTPSGAGGLRHPPHTKAAAPRARPAGPDGTPAAAPDRPGRNACRAHRRAVHRSSPEAGGAAEPAALPAAAPRRPDRRPRAAVRLPAPEPAGYPTGLQRTRPRRPGRAGRPLRSRAGRGGRLSQRPGPAAGPGGRDRRGAALPPAEPGTRRSLGRRSGRAVAGAGGASGAARRPPAGPRPRPRTRRAGTPAGRIGGPPCPASLRTGGRGRTGGRRPLRFTACPRPRGDRAGFRAERSGGEAGTGGGLRGRPAVPGGRRPRGAVRRDVRGPPERRGEEGGPDSLRGRAPRWPGRRSGFGRGRADGVEAVMERDAEAGAYAGGESERLRRWRLVLGGAAEGELGPAGAPGGGDARVDAALGVLYDGAGDAEAERDGPGSLGASAPGVARWLGDVRELFPPGVVQVMQADALDRLGLRRMLLEPDLVEAVRADVHLAAALLSLREALPDRARESARAVVRRVAAELEERLARRTRAAVHGALDRSARADRPRRAADVDWPATIRRNLRHRLPEQGTVVPETRVGRARRAGGVRRDVVLAVDQSASMAASLVYAGVFGAVLASVRSLRTSFVAFDTSVADLTGLLSDPVEVLFGTSLGGGTDVNRALEIG